MAGIGFYNIKPYNTEEYNAPASVPVPEVITGGTAGPGISVAPSVPVAAPSPGAPSAPTAPPAAIPGVPTAPLAPVAAPAPIQVVTAPTEAPAFPVAPPVAMPPITIGPRVTMSVVRSDPLLMTRPRGRALRQLAAILEAVEGRVRG
jgi:hypothetical protein